MLIIVPEVSINAENVNKPSTSKSYKYLETEMINIDKDE